MSGVKGVRPANLDSLHAARRGTKLPQVAGPNNAGWKGDDVGYSALHHWVARHLGKPGKCEQCGTESAKQFEWANKSGQYLRDLSDWRRLCTSCHRKEGYARGEYTA